MGHTLKCKALTTAKGITHDDGGRLFNVNWCTDTREGTFLKAMELCLCLAAAKCMLEMQECVSLHPPSYGSHLRDQTREHRLDQQHILHISTEDMS